MKLKSLLLATTLGLTPVVALAMDDATPSTPNLSVDDAVAYGQELYEEVAFCVACHGYEGEGGIGTILTLTTHPASSIMFQMEANVQMSETLAMLDPIDPDKFYALSLYLNKLAGIENTEEMQAELYHNAVMTVEQKIARMADEVIYEHRKWEDVPATWERRAKTGSIKSHFDIAVTEIPRTDAEPIFTPEPGKTYFYEATALPKPVFAPSYITELADSSQMVVGDAETKEVLGHFSMPQDLRAEIHTTFAAPDGKHVYMLGGLSDLFEAEPGARMNSMPATILKLDALTLEPLQTLDIGGRIHHGQAFQDKYLLIDTFRTTDEGVDVFLMDPETNEMVGGVRGEDLGGTTYTSFSDDEFIYLLMAPGNYTGNGGFDEGRHHSSGVNIETRDFWVAKIDPETWEVVQEIPYPGVRGNWVTIDSAKEHMYVTAGASSMVSKMHIATGERIWTASTDTGPYGASLTTDEGELWVANKGEGTGSMGRTVTVVDTETGQVTHTLFSLYNVDHILLAPNGKEMWATSNMEGRIVVFDTETYEQTHVIDMPGAGAPHGLVWVNYGEDGEPRLVRDQGGFRNGINPALGETLDY